MPFHHWVEDTPVRMRNGKGFPVDLTLVDFLTRQVRSIHARTERAAQQGAETIGSYKPTQRGR